MKYTEKYFKFPVKVYDAASIKRAIAAEEATDIPTDGEWVIGYAKIPFWELQNTVWYDVFSKGRSVSEVAEKGFDAVVVFHPIFGEFECVWPMKKFEDKLNKFVEDVEAAQAEEEGEYEDGEEEIVEEETGETEAEVEGNE